MALNRLPPFSPILTKLIASLAGEDVSFALLGDLIEKDSVLAANILRVVNSAVYARRGEVNSVRRALSVLGVTRVRNTVLAMSVSRMLNQAATPPGWSMERFNKHAAAVAMLADLLAQRTPTEYPEGAFAAGLLHDLGRLLIAIALPEEFAELRAEASRRRCPWQEVELQILGFDHSQLSSEAMDEWKLPLEIRDAIHFHHTPPSRSPAPLSLILNAADSYVDAVGLSIEDPRNPSDDAEASLDVLALNPDARAELLNQFHTEYETLAPFYR